MRDEVDFLLADKHQMFLQTDTIFFYVCVARHVQITQFNELTIFLQYLKKEMNDEFDFLFADMHESFLQVDLIFHGDGQEFPKFPK